MQLDKEVNLNDSALDKIIGVYSATFKKNQTLSIYKNDGKLYMDLSNGTGKHMLMQPLSNTLFVLPDVKLIRTTCEIVLENGRVA